MPNPPIVSIALKEEKAFNSSIGFTYSTGGFTATIDAYSISVKDRIVLTDNFDASGLGLGVDAAQFFANGVDTKTTGIDFVLSYKTSLNDNSSMSVGIVFYSCRIIYYKMTFSYNL